MSPFLCSMLSVTIVSAMRSWLVWPVLVVGGATALGCSATPAALPSSAPGTLRVEVTSVTPILEPYNPQISHHGLPAEQVNFILTGVPMSSSPSHIHCDIGVFHSGRRVGSTSVVAGATTSQSVSVEVDGNNFAGKPSDAHVVCRRSANPFDR